MWLSTEGVTWLLISYTFFCNYSSSCGIFLNIGTLVFWIFQFQNCHLCLKVIIVGNLEILMICKNLMSKNYVKTLLANTMSITKYLFGRVRKLWGRVIFLQWSLPRILLILSYILLTSSTLCHKRMSINFKVYSLS